METTRICPQCRQPLEADAPNGLCPECLIKAAAGPPPTASADGLADDFIDIADPAEVARKLPQFEIGELLGRGGMGVVYKANQKQLDRVVALKILPPLEATSPDFVARFTREARALAKLNHPNIVHVYDFGETNGLYYIIMEFVDGANLRQLFEAGKMTAAEALAIVPKICDALQYAHEEGVVHRDIKPENILIDKKGRLKIADFGLAKLLRREALDMTLTLSGMSLGTVRYMAPEQMDKPETVDHRADLYSLGVVIYEMLTGEVPVGRYELPSQKAQVDVRFDEIVLHALEREPARRYQHASEVRDDVERVTSKPQVAPSPSAEPPSPTAAEFRQQDAREILATVMAILLGLSVVGVIAALAGLTRVLFPALRMDMEVGAVDSLGRDGFEFAGMLVMSSMALFLLPKARRQGRDRLARINAASLILVGALLTFACARQWFGLAVPYWIGGIYSLTAIVCWILLRGKDVTAALRAGPAAAKSPNDSASTDQLHSKLQLAAIGNPAPRHLLSASLVLLSLFGFFFGLSFQAKQSGSAAGLTRIITVGVVDPLFVNESGPSGFETGFNFFSWSFLAVVVAGIAFGALWRIGREDQGKVARDPAWWRDWWKQVGIWGGLLLIACIVRTVKDPARVLQPAGERTVQAKFDKSSQAVTYLDGHTSAVKAVAVSPDGRTLVSAGMDGRVLVRDLPSGKLRRTAIASSHPNSAPLTRFRSGIITPDGQRAIVGGDMRELQSIRLFLNPSDALNIDLLRVPNEMGATIDKLVSAGGNKLAYITGRDESEIVFYDAAEARTIAKVPLNPGQSSHVARAVASPDGQFIAVTSARLAPTKGDPSISETVAPFRLAVLDATGAERLSWSFADSPDYVYAQVVFSDTHTLAVCLPSGKLLRWTLDDAGTWRPAAEAVRIVPGRYTASAASRDGKIIWLAEGTQVAGIDSTTGQGIAQIDFKIGERLENYFGSAIDQIAVTNEPLTIAAALWDGRVALAKCWPIKADAVTSFQARPIETGPNGPQLTADTIRKLKLPSLQTGEANKILQKYAGEAHALERRHTKIAKSDQGHVLVTIEPFSDECLDLARKMVAELGGVVPQDILPAIRPGALPGEIFRSAGECRHNIELWKEGGKYFREHRQSDWVPAPGMSRSDMSSSSSGPKMEEVFFGDYRLYWTEE